MSVTKKKPHKAHKPAKARTVKPRRHRLHVPPGGSFAFNPTSMSQAMVDRLFWRAGFGPSAADRAAWIGKPLDDAVDSLLNTPQGALVGADPTRDGKPLDPTGDDTRPGARVGRPHGADEQSAGRAPDVLLAPPLGELARGRLADAAARDPERAVPQVRRFRRQPGCVVPRHDARGVQGPLDAALPERRVERQGRPRTRTTAAS